MATSKTNSLRRFTRIGKPRVPNAGPEEDENDQEILIEALADAIARAKDEGWETVWYVTPTKKALSLREIHEEALGSSIFKAMQTASGAQVQGITLKSISSGDITAWHRPSVLLVLYPDKKMLEEIEIIRQAHGVVIVPWTDHPNAAYRKKWGATEI